MQQPLKINWKFIKFIWNWIYFTLYLYLYYSLATLKVVAILGIWFLLSKTDFLELNLTFLIRFGMEINPNHTQLLDREAMASWHRRETPYGPLEQKRQSTPTTVERKGYTVKVPACQMEASSRLSTTLHSKTPKPKRTTAT